MAQIDKPETGLALTMGEPGGIGGELSLKTWIERDRNNTPAFFVIDSVERLQRIASNLGWTVAVEEISSPDQCEAVFHHALPVLSVGMVPSYIPGQATAASATAVCRSIEMAVELAMNDDVRAIVTNPIQKNALYDAGFKYPGHTEFIAHLSGGIEPVMMLASPELRVVPLSIHEPIVQAITSINSETIVRKSLIVANALRQDFALADPRLAMAGLNPHAGENATMGFEDSTIIAPAIETLRRSGLNVMGPVPPDALFMARMRSSYDVAICHYHDQALIPIKAIDVERAVNVTVGLPIIRTSPDHGTALDIAGTGTAEPTSLIAALHMADNIARNRRDAQISKDTR